MKPLYLLLLYFALLLSYAAWKGNARAVEEKIYHNSKGELVYPVPVKSLEKVKEMGSGMYYTAADGQTYTDINEQVHQHFNWEAFFQVATFGCALALLVLLVTRLSNRFAKENQ
jgi:hypothetical protein